MESIGSLTVAKQLIDCRRYNVTDNFKDCKDCLDKKVCDELGAMVAEIDCKYAAPINIKEQVTA